ncbi:mercuric reductase [Parachlamydia sp. AcF125]|uniref:mercuric reductase n=1 Tax=Parachlamydia sp. AcF125 TaxID=2795736 RepID=UPI001BC91AF7|nr:mercuric reductase [Parachlamydia sp. AcF125]MBS4168606.1 Dihydrolipoyl dehydrogenase [Parachlamydia sp. AcF125]
MVHSNTPPHSFSAQLQEDVFPLNWKNPKPVAIYDLLVVGGGPGGMTAATLAKKLDAQVAFVEKEHFGGECLSYGCIPSKAMIRSSRLVAEVCHAQQFGVEIPPNWKVNFHAVMQRVHRLQATISPHDSAEHFKKLGIDVFLGTGRFIGPNQLEVSGQIINFKKAIIATGTQPVPFEIPGLSEADYHTNQTIFSLSTLPARLGVIGGGPISCELSQAFLRFGSQVTLMTHGSHLLPKDSPMATERLRKELEREGMQIFTQTKVVRVEKKGKEKVLYLDQHSTSIPVDEILIAAGRAPVVEGLGLDQAGVSYDSHQGISTNDFLQTSNPNIYAIGDVTSKYKFTHISKELASIAVTNALKDGQEQKNALIVPWCTFTSPEIAHVGLSQEEAQERGIATEIAVVELADVDRAILDEETTGFVRLMVKKGSHAIIGADIMAEHAGDLIAQVGVAMASEKGLLALAKSIHPFPTQSQAIRTAAERLLQQQSSVNSIETSKWNQAAKLL